MIWWENFHKLCRLSIKKILHLNVHARVDTLSSGIAAFFHLSTLIFLGSGKQFIFKFKKKKTRKYDAVASKKLYDSRVKKCGN
jgi:hypothetical protein